MLFFPLRSGSPHVQEILPLCSSGIPKSSTQGNHPNSLNAKVILPSIQKTKELENCFYMCISGDNKDFLILLTDM